MIDTHEMRLDLLEMGKAAGMRGIHLGGSLSLVEIMAALYGVVMNFNPKAPDSPERDRLILSKGHGLPAQHAALKQLGVFTKEQLLTYKQDTSLVSVHPSRNLKLGIEYSSGSLGQGLSIGVGVAFALKKQGKTAPKVFVILGDGECDEGQVWEAAMSASQFRLDNLVAIIDRNRLQSDRNTEEVIALDDFKAKWTSFGWNAVECDGHDLNALTNALQKPHHGPLTVIANTVKGKGISFMENNPAWHNSTLTAKLYDEAMQEVS